MLVGRFSHAGFEPQVQTHMRGYVDHLLSWDEEETKRLFPDSWRVMKLGVQVGLENMNHEFTFRGIHVFFLPLEESTVSFQLNHLKGDRPPYYEMSFLDDTPACSMGSCWNKPILTLALLRDQGHDGAYIPF